MNELTSIQEAMDIVRKNRINSLDNDVIWKKLDRIYNYLTSVYNEKFQAYFNKQ